MTSQDELVAHLELLLELARNHPLTTEGFDTEVEREHVSAPSLGQAPGAETRLLTGVETHWIRFTVDVHQDFVPPKQ